jgi:NAD(P)-dependent dehydrogenase (short-subunit alcohol dehydrogenase family)
VADTEEAAYHVALVTGAGSGIGRAIAHRLAADGAAVAVVDIDRAAAERTASEINGPVVAFAADVSDGGAVAATMEAAVARLGPVSILVNNAGISRGGRVQDIEEMDWDHVLGVNLRGTFLCCKYAVPHMIAAGRGRIVNISSGTGVRVGPGTGPYAASKAGVIALTKSIAGELARYGITANVVAPGITDTPMTRSAFGGGDQLLKLATEGAIANPMRVVIAPEDIAAAVAFLGGDDARYITGQTLHVNAGSFMP